ncbi:MAG TPA: ABC transporter permease [Saprospiraceae bacterium]|jgi:putative ABC transport system permease protein|nr:ABC transporter permease [Saprospiraceae bacterium]HRJ13836.1 ABC transporter permease [Saprospiraceae bacterium]HRK80307.1 ABC transporter permease [Saprospiraceae bacterium]
MERWLFNFGLALRGINANKLRSLLTALGIVFGVAAVIAMLSIGSGAKRAILDQMRLIGANNIVLEAIVPDPEKEASSGGSNANGNNKDKRPWSPGLSLADIQAIRENVPGVESVSPEIVLPTTFVYGGKQEKGRCIGVENTFFYLNRLELGAGKLFHAEHFEAGRPVCIIGKDVQSRFFAGADPMGKKFKCGNTWFTVIGVLQKRNAGKETLDNLGIKDYNTDVFIPIQTALLRFENRAVISKSDLGRGNDEGKSANYHQIDRAVIRMESSKLLPAAADLMARMLKRRHRDVVDYEVEVPELLLQQEQKTQDTFNMVLAAIAAISLLVGGIGIMNIMLASVLERIQEIGVRRALGARQSDIVQQFLLEAVMISLFGGMIGVLLGVLAARIIAASADIPTIIAPWSVLVSFAVAAAVGLIFGIFPARRAALQDPITALRRE